MSNVQQCDKKVLHVYTFFCAFNDHVLIGASEQKKKLSPRSGCRFHQLVVSEQKNGACFIFLHQQKVARDGWMCIREEHNKQIKVKTIMGQVCRGGFRSRLQHCSMQRNRTSTHSCWQRTGSLIFALMGCWVINHTEER